MAVVWANNRKVVTVTIRVDSEVEPVGGPVPVVDSKATSIMIRVDLVVVKEGEVTVASKASNRITGTKIRVGWVDKDLAVSSNKVVWVEEDSKTSGIGKMTVSEVSKVVDSVDSRITVMIKVDLVDKTTTGVVVAVDKGKIPRIIDSETT